MPQHCPTPRELDDLELLLTGALAPLDRFNEPGSVVTLTVPENLRSAADAAGGVEIVDPEGLPLARVATSGEITPLKRAQYGPFRRLYLSPAQARRTYPGRAVVPVTDALSLADLAAIGSTPVVLLALVGDGTPQLPAVALIRATLAAADLLDDAVVVAVPLAAHDDAEADHALGVSVVAAYSGDADVLALPESEGDYPASIAAIVDQAVPALDEQGLVLFFTGLSGSGKSTLARALMDRILERGERTITSLDGDVVRRHLSAGLTFSKEDRETNIKRIGWVAAEIARHGGLAVCSPIAPFDQTRQDVRQMVDAAGGAFFLVHVATPLEECERRDRKGLYAKARRGEIPEFTGISSPYEAPADADVVVDTTGRSIDEALDDVLVGLRDAGYLDLTAPATDPLNVLFVCTANICRSPAMELLARQATGADSALVFASAGTHGFDRRPMDDAMAAVTADRGVDSSEFSSQPLSRDLIEWADIILTAEATHRAFILDDHPAIFRKVFTLGQFAAAASRSPQLRGRELIADAGAHRGAADASLDIDDPYRKGAEAARVATERIAGLVATVVNALQA